MQPRLNSCFEAQFFKVKPAAIFASKLLSNNFILIDAVNRYGNLRLSSLF